MPRAYLVVADILPQTKEKMKEEHRKKVEEIMGEMSCPKNFECEKSGFEILCKAEDNGMQGHVDCLDAEPRSCTFSVPFGYGCFCRCSLRVYLSKELKL